MEEEKESESEASQDPLEENSFKREFERLFQRLESMESGIRLEMRQEAETWRQEVKMVRQEIGTDINIRDERRECEIQS